MTQEKKPQLVHTTRQMFETRWAKYNDPHNLEWDFDDITDKWERHAWSAFLDLQTTEAERDALLQQVRELREAAKVSLHPLEYLIRKGVLPVELRPSTEKIITNLRAALDGKGGEGDG